MALRYVLILACTYQDVSSLQVSKKKNCILLIPPMRATWTSLLFIQVKFQQMVDSNGHIHTVLRPRGQQSDIYRRANLKPNMDYLWNMIGQVLQNIINTIWATGRITEEPWFDSRHWSEIVLFCTGSRPALWPTQPLIQWVEGALSRR